MCINFFVVVVVYLSSPEVNLKLFISTMIEKGESF